MSLLIFDTILDAKEREFDFFDFGTSSVNMIGRENIFRFKESFGSIGNFRHTYLKNL
jgi:lipid II:glycine glycyltransferase (peptidoglycan interpeptide bridge formation enzyme)